eukprot:g9243.t1
MEDQQHKHGQPQRVSRTLSVSSRAAVNTVGQLKNRFTQLEQSLKKTTEVVSSQSSSLEELLEAKLELAQIIGTLEKFQFNEVDAVVTHGLSSGKEEVRQERKELTRAVTSLAEEATGRHKEVSELIAAMTPPSGSSEGGGGRHITLPDAIASRLPKSKLLTEAELQSLGVQQSRGWQHYSIHRPEPNILLFRRALGTDPATGQVDRERLRAAQQAFVQQLSQDHH